MTKQQSKYKMIPESDEDGGFYVSLDDLRIMYHALKQYRPKKHEKHLHEILLEEFEEAVWTEAHADDEAEPDAESLNDL
jgi:hypothetical protein